jgi:hypothetical protein
MDQLLPQCPANLFLLHILMTLQKMMGPLAKTPRALVQWAREHSRKQFLPWNG